MQALSNILTMVLVLAIAALPLSAASTTVAEMGHSAVVQSDDCHGAHHHHATADKSGEESQHSEKISCALACAGMCWANAVSAAPHVLLGRVEGIVGPVMADSLTLPLIASPPFRPPRF